LRFWFDLRSPCIFLLGRLAFLINCRKKKHKKTQPRKNPRNTTRRKKTTPKTQHTTPTPTTPKNAAKTQHQETQQAGRCSMRYLLYLAAQTQLASGISYPETPFAHGPPIAHGPWAVCRIAHDTSDLLSPTRPQSAPHLFENLAFEWMRFLQPLSQLRSHYC
jgi:hypothetical protein